MEPRSVALRALRCERVLAAAVFAGCWTGGDAQPGDLILEVWQPWKVFLLCCAFALAMLLGLVVRWYRRWVWFRKVAAEVDVPLSTESEDVAPSAVCNAAPAKHPTVKPPPLRRRAAAEDGQVTLFPKPPPPKKVWIARPPKAKQSPAPDRPVAVKTSFARRPPLPEAQFAGEPEHVSSTSDDSARDRVSHISPEDYPSFHAEGLRRRRPSTCPKVSTPPTEPNNEQVLPPSYEELVARALHRELQRAPTDEEVTLEVAGVRRIETTAR